MQNAIFDRVSKVMSKTLNCDTGKITLGTRLQDLGMDSLAMVELVLNFETEFKIEINDDESQKLTTVQKIVDFIEQKTG